MTIAKGQWFIWAKEEGFLCSTPNGRMNKKVRPIFMMGPCDFDGPASLTVANYNSGASAREVHQGSTMGNYNW